jgi:hypothetical protein
MEYGQRNKILSGKTFHCPFVVCARPRQELPERNTINSPYTKVSRLNAASNLLTVAGWRGVVAGAETEDE